MTGLNGVEKPSTSSSSMQVENGASPAKYRYSFMDDYSEATHPRILQALSTTNTVQQLPYGDDEYSQRAKRYIQSHIIDHGPSPSTSPSTSSAAEGRPEMEIFFVPTGTSANLISIAACLRPFEAVIAASTAHIATQEAGAIAALGHTILPVEPVDGKVTASNVAKAVKANDIPPHTVLPRLVYISNASESGTIYTKAELQALSETCQRHGLLLFMDGARLGAALSASSTLTLRDVFDLTDIFWIGGTKNGALFGEAVVVKHPDVARTFAYHVKQRGALLAKGRVLGVQFAELFRDNLYFELAGHANAMAQRLAGVVQRFGYSVTATVQTNQIFAVMPWSVIHRLQEGGEEGGFAFHVWEEMDEEKALVRLVTSWATDVGQVDAFGAALAASL